ncbi:MAG: nucleotide-binding protein [Gemmataceae bacterium]|nr:nucleotide-binding protein [Gemmataceae bacterium]
MTLPSNYDSNVFINCPFDEDYKPLFQAVVFSVCSLSMIPRCALEASDAAQVRLEKIMTIIGECRFGILDISRTELDQAHNLPRFNMPLELGIFLGCKRFGNKLQRRKSCLILDRERFRFQKFISDISGQDPAAHKSRPAQIIRRIRDWIRAETKRYDIRGADFYVAQFRSFQKDLPNICQELHYQPKDLTFPDLLQVITSWLTKQRAETSARP